MMPLFREMILAVSSSLAASIIAKATISTAAALLAVRVARSSRASLRHTLLSTAFGVLLALPVMSLVTPPVRMAVAEAAGVAATSAISLSRTSAGGAPTPQTGAVFPLPALLLAAWTAGAAAFLIPVLMGLWQVRSLRRSAFPWARGQSVTDGLALEAGIQRYVQVLLHADVPGPMTCGVLHPAIVLPRDAESWAPADWHRAIVHELEHVRRWDWISHCLARMACALYWFHPLVWMAWRQLALEAERSCDDAVLKGSEATAYADQLVELARRMHGNPKSPLLAMASRADLSTRVAAVLNGTQRRGRAGRLAVGLACLAAGLFVLTMSPLTIVAAQQSTPAPATPPVPRFMATSGLVTVDVTVIDQNGRSVDGLTAGSFTLSEDGVAQTISVFEFQRLEGAPNSPASYYVLGYYTTNPRADGSFRKLSLVCTDPTAKLNFRSGYYARQRPDLPAGPGGARMDADVRPPVLIFKKEPTYSEAARKAKYQGIVVLQVEVDETGQPKALKVLRSLGLGLDEQAIEAVKQWRFRPGTQDGKPVTTQTEVAVNFQLL